MWVWLPAAGLVVGARRVPGRTARGPRPRPLPGDPHARPGVHRRAPVQGAALLHRRPRRRSPCGATGRVRVRPAAPARTSSASTSPVSSCTTCSPADAGAVRHRRPEPRPLQGRTRVRGRPRPRHRGRGHGRAADPDQGAGLHGVVVLRRYLRRRCSRSRYGTTDTGELQPHAVGDLPRDDPDRWGGDHLRGHHRSHRHPDAAAVRAVDVGLRPRHLAQRARAASSRSTSSRASCSVCSSWSSW